MAEPSPFGAGNPERPSLRYVFLRFLRYGFLAWGGPVAQIGLMHRELVERDGWVEEGRFRKTLALYQALPGPEAHELTVWFGMLKRGRVGGLLAGLGFMLPGVVLVTLLAAAYVAFAQTSAVAETLLYGVRPAVLALIAFAFWRLAKHGLNGWDLALVGVLAAAVGLLAPQVSFLLVLLAGGLLILAARAGRGVAPALLVLGASFPALTLAGMGALAVLSAKVGLLTFGGAYTAIPFLREGAVEQQGWMTDDQFLDALALTGLVPGPLIAIGTFVGYVAGGWAGALLATVIIFTPAFAFTLVGHGFFERIVGEPRLHAFLLGVTAAVIGLIVAATVPLAQAAVHDLPTLLLALAALGALASKRVPIPVVILGAAAAGGLVAWAGG
ncbi:MAG TPA: chromate efflux transporter [Candidatus Thermoplasmatota archaeon]|nr:chromate efflux transporter [Candidatus Thermoplasmatota archaeon]